MQIFKLERQKHDHEVSLTKLHEAKEKAIRDELMKDIEVLTL